jgi:hypothetical protein
MVLSRLVGKSMSLDLASEIVKLRAEIERLKALLKEIDEETYGGQISMSHDLRMKLWKEMERHDP